MKFKQRDKNDYYPTKKEDILKSLNIIGTQKINKVLDLASGSGVWGETFLEYYDDGNIEITAVDIQNFPKNDKFDNWYMDYDFLKENNSDKLGNFDLIISNPPYKYAQEFIEKSFELLNNNGQMIMLLRLSFLESQKRYEFFKKYKPKEIQVFSKRPSFTGDGKTFPMAFATYNWVKDFSGDTKLSWIL